MVRRLVSTALAALTLLTVVQAPLAHAQPLVLVVELTEFRISPSQIEVALGEELSIHILNNGSQNHTFVIETYANYDSNIPPGGRATVYFTADAVGTYPMYCVIPGHRALGMEGTFTIRRFLATPPLPVVEVAGLLVATALAAIAVVVLLRSRQDSET